jgi:hypothetical protein
MDVPANFLLTSIPGAHVDAVAVPRVKDGVALDMQLGLGLSLHANAEAAIRRELVQNWMPPLLVLST